MKVEIRSNLPNISAWHFHVIQDGVMVKFCIERCRPLAILTRNKLIDEAVASGADEVTANPVPMEPTERELHL